MRYESMIMTTSKIPVAAIVSEVCIVVLSVCASTTPVNAMWFTTTVVVTRWVNIRADRVLQRGTAIVAAWHRCMILESKNEYLQQQCMQEKLCKHYVTAAAIDGSVPKNIQVSQQQPIHSKSLHSPWQ